jgi:hypothetical protein
MRRRILPAFLVTALLLTTLPVAADSIPVIEGDIDGIELCPQSICGAAFFIGQFAGHVNALPRQGVFLGAITHQPLPEPDETSFITGGTWLIRIPFRTFRGVVLPGGTLTNNGDNTFTVAITMLITQGGTGTLNFTGTLSHEVFPPTIVGTLSQD